MKNQAQSESETQIKTKSIPPDLDLLVIGAGPVGLLCGFLAKQSGMTVTVVDPTTGPLQVGRADALNARTLQLLETVGLFKDLYPRGKPCKTSSVWANGSFVSRQSSWWDELEGCLHKHFLMLGQAHLEKLLDQKLCELGVPVRRETRAVEVRYSEEDCTTHLSNGEMIRSKYLIGADGAHSLVRKSFGIPFEITKPQITWAVLDGIIETDFEKVPEIVVFQSETSDVAWIPREGDLDRFYVIMDSEKLELEQALQKINRAMHPHTLRFKELTWASHFSVKESVAERFSIGNRVFLAGDACHIHSVNGGQGLNTGIGDAFNLIWKLALVAHGGATPALLHSYEMERKPVALSVVETSGALVRSTQHSAERSHAQNYVKIVETKSGNITGMGIRYEGQGLVGTRVFDFELSRGGEMTRLYSLLRYDCFTLLVFGSLGGSLDTDLRGLDFPKNVQIIKILPESDLHADDGTSEAYFAQGSPYADQVILVRPDSYIESHKLPLVRSEVAG